MSTNCSLRPILITQARKGRFSLATYLPNISGVNVSTQTVRRMLHGNLQLKTVNTNPLTRNHRQVRFEWASELVGLTSLVWSRTT